MSYERVCGDCIWYDEEGFRWDVPDECVDGCRPGCKFEQIEATDDELRAELVERAKTSTRLHHEVELLKAIAEADLDDRCCESTPESKAAHLAAHRAYDAWIHVHRDGDEGIE
jgi:hypothetical protein